MVKLVEHTINKEYTLIIDYGHYWKYACTSKQAVYWSANINEVCTGNWFKVPWALENWLDTTENIKVVKEFDIEQFEKDHPEYFI